MESRSLLSHCIQGCSAWRENAFANSTLGRLFAASVFALSLASCGGGGGSSTAPNSNAGSGTNTPAVTTPTGTGTVSGVIQDINGSPITGATVSAVGKTITTAADGVYTFSTDAALTSALVLVKKAGFSTVAKEVPTGAGLTSKLDIKIFADQVKTTFNTATAASITVGAATVQIPANALRFEDGTAFTGTASINASYYSPDTLQGVQAFAGPYVGTDGGIESPIISMGFVEVKLADSSGKALQLKAGSVATLNLPASSNAAGAATIPMWFYDEAAGLWKREGTAAKQANGSYQGTVTHFTIWNLDFKGETATITGCFVDSAGQPLRTVGTVGIRGTGWSRTLGTGLGLGTAAAGSFTILRVVAGTPLELFSMSSPATFATVSIPALSANENRSLGSTCIVATGAPAVSPVVVPPVVVFNPVAPTTTTASFAAEYRGTYSGAETGTFAVSVNATGVISGTVTSQTFNQTLPVTGTVSNSGGVTITTGGSAGSARFSGSINANGIISGTWNYIGVTTGGTFTGTRVLSAVGVASTGIDAYVGTWTSCTAVPSPGSGSYREIIVFTKASSSTLNWADTSTDYSAANCTGTASRPENSTGTLTFQGQKTLSSGDVVDKVTVVELTSDAQGANALFNGRTITASNGQRIWFGYFLLPPDSEGYPSALWATPVIKQ
jgi:hypothetical protein